MEASSGTNKKTNKKKNKNKVRKQLIEYINFLVELH